MIANPALGVLRYQNNYYAFSCKDAAYEFSNAPDRFVLAFPNYLLWFYSNRGHFSSLANQIAIPTVELDII